MTLECELVSYDEETCHMVGKIVNVSADERILTPDGKIDISLLQPIIYDTITKNYHTIGPKVGNALSDGKTIK